MKGGDNVFLNDDEAIVNISFPNPWCNCRGVDVLFQKRVRGFHQVSKHEKTFETTRPQAEWFYCFRVFGNLMKPEARVFEITSPTKKIRSTYHFNEFSRFKYSICGS